MASIGELDACLDLRGIETSSASVVVDLVWMECERRSRNLRDACGPISKRLLDNLVLLNDRFGLPGARVPNVPTISISNPEVGSKVGFEIT